MVWVTRLELATSRPPVLRATKLRHTQLLIYYTQIMIINQLIFDNLCGNTQINIEIIFFCVMEYIKYLDIIELLRADGSRKPIAVLYDGEKYEIDKIASVRREASLYGGGYGTCYECIICGVRRKLYFNGDRWFIENKVNYDN